MIYSNWKQFANDLLYADTILDDFRDVRGATRYESNLADARKIKQVWLQEMRSKYEQSKGRNNPLGRFIQKYDLPFKEMCSLIDLVNDEIRKSDYETSEWIQEDDEDHFAKHKVTFEFSKLKREKLVFKIVNPMRPNSVKFSLTYKVQMEILGKTYHEAYRQQDMALEEQSKINSPDQMESLYYLIKPKFSFDDLIVSDDLKRSLSSALVREQNKKLIFNKWGLGKMVEYGRGTTLNFRGPPGTGKTLSAHVLAHELSKELMIVRYDQLQNAYIGVTEKHIQQVFRIAKLKNAVLFFDEADAVAMSRAYLEKSWELSQINTLLKEIERFEGVCIFATNYSDKYDPALERRLTMHLDFELPDKHLGLKLMDKLLPLRARDAEVNLERLDFMELSGGDMKNAVLNAAGFAALEKCKKICQKHLEQGLLQVRKAKKILPFDKNGVGYYG